MKRDFMTGLKMIPFGLSKTSSLVFMLLFILLGLMMEIAVSFSWMEQSFFAVDMGALLMFCAVMYPAQLLMSTDISLLVQASPYKKKLQTSVPVVLSLCGNIIVMTVVILVKVAAALAAPERTAEIFAQLQAVGMIALCMSLLGVIIYKYFFLTIVVLYVAILALGIVNGVRLAQGGTLASGFELPIPVTVVLCFVMVFLGTGLQYLLTKAIYKKPFSKLAFGATAKKYM